MRAGVVQLSFEGGRTTMRQRSSLALPRSSGSLPPSCDDVAGVLRYPHPWESPDRTLYRGPLFTIGAFRAAPDHPRFRDSGPINEAVFVFPRTTVTIQHEGSRP